jgi:hypothetical protein
MLNEKIGKLKKILIEEFRLVENTIYVCEGNIVKHQPRLCKVQNEENVK